MEQIISDHSLCSLFLLGFGASTLLPLGSEWLLALLVIEGIPIIKIVAVATAGNFLGALTTYLMGVWGADFVISKILHISPEQSIRAQETFRKWGTWSLLLSWLPIVGDPLCLAAGIFRINPITFSVLVITGKTIRYIIVACLVSSALT